MENFTYQAGTKVLFGKGELDQLPQELIPGTDSLRKQNSYVLWRRIDPAYRTV